MITSKKQLKVEFRIGEKNSYINLKNLPEFYEKNVKQ